MAKVNWLRALEIEEEFYTYICEMSRYGFLVDRDQMLTHIDTLTYQMDDIEKEVDPALPLWYEKVGVTMGKPFNTNGELCVRATEWLGEQDVEIVGPFTRVILKKTDIGSQTQLKEYLLSQGWVPEAWNYQKEDNEKAGRKKGDRTSPKMSITDAFMGITSDVGKKVAFRLQCRHRRSQLEGWVKAIRMDGRIPAGSSGLADTRRLKHRTIVNIPGFSYDKDGNLKGAFFGKEMRSCFIAKEGYKIVGCDASSCQLRLLAHYMGDAAYTKAVLEGKQEDGTDIHTVNQRAAGLDTRGQAKNFIYAFIFGAGNLKLSLMLGISLGKVNAVRKRFLKGLPALARLIDTVVAVLEKNGYLVAPDGGKIFIDSPHKALCYLLQTAEAVIMKLATNYAHQWIKRDGLDAHMVAHVHDEYQWEVKDEDTVAVGELLKEAIVKAYKDLGITVPGDGDYKVGLSWACTH